MKDERIENPIEVPGALSFLAYGTFQSYVHGLDEYPKDQWPDNIEHALQQMRNLKDDVKYKIMRGNAERVFRFTPAEPPVLA